MSRITIAAEDTLFERALFNQISGLDSSWVLEWVENTFSPQDVFEADVLERWARDNGYIKERQEGATKG